MLGITKTAPPWKWAAFRETFTGGRLLLFRSGRPALQGLLGMGRQRLQENCRLQKKIQPIHIPGASAARDRHPTPCCAASEKTVLTATGVPTPFLSSARDRFRVTHRRWDLLPFAFENIWSQMEYLCGKRYLDFSQLEADVQRLPTPENRWSAFETDRKNRWEAWCSQTPPNQEKIKSALRLHSGSPQCMMPLIERQFL